jgi:hypothetical protein
VLLVRQGTAAMGTGGLQTAQGLDSSLASGSTAAHVQPGRVEDLTTGGTGAAGRAVSASAFEVGTIMYCSQKLHHRPLSPLCSVHFETSCCCAVSLWQDLRKCQLLCCCTDVRAGPKRGTRPAPHPASAPARVQARRVQSDRTLR